MSGSNYHSSGANSPTPLAEEEPLLSGGDTKSDAVLISGGKSPSKSNLIKSNLHHRSVDNSIDNSSSVDGLGSTASSVKPHKQILFRTGFAQQPSVHYHSDVALSNGGQSNSADMSNKGTNTDAANANGSNGGGSGNRFKVNKVNSSGSGNNTGNASGVTGIDEEENTTTDSEADNDSLHAHIYATAGYDTKNLKSFKHYTREALPRVDNYRNILSIHGHAERPTLDELHGVQTTIQFDSKNKTVTPAIESVDPSKIVKFGWIEGVLIRCLLNIWGVILFIRLSWVAGQAGIIYGSITVLLASVCTMITTMSMAAICTNGEVRGGGTYYMISRSLGPEFGGAIGIIFSLANAVAVAMYCIGFSETVRDMLLQYGKVIFDGGMNDIRLIGCVTVIILTIIVFIGTEWESKTQMGLLAILLVAMCNFCVGSVLPPRPDQVARGYIGWNINLIWENMKPVYKGESFISVFSIYFPAATGILAGANISGDLRDPSKAIPQGTFLSIILTTITYVGFLIVVACNVLRDANGVVDLVVNKTAITPQVVELIRNCDLAPNHECKYGTLNNFQIMEMMSWFGPLIYAGIYAATLSSALASLVSAPKVFQALCNDKLLPYIEYFGKGYGVNNEPRRGYALTFFIGFACCLIGELNAIAPIISNFFLAAYMLINFACFHATFSKSPGFRPAFKYYSMWMALVGSLFCLVVMFIMNWFSALLTFIIVLALYMWIQHRKPDVNWGSSTQAQNYRSAISSVYRLNVIPEHVKTYRPQVLLLSGNPGTHSAAVDLAYLMTKSCGMLICGNIITSPISNRAQNVILQDSILWLVQRNVKAFVQMVQETNFYTGVKSMVQSTGIGKLRPNIVMLGFKNDWINEEQNELLNYFRTIHLIFDKHLSLVIISIPDNLAVTGVTTNGGSSVKTSSVSINLNSKESSGIGSDENVTNAGTVRLVQEATYFQIKQKKGYIDVWWLYDDGGLTLLLPYLISSNPLWKDCKLRIFALVNKKSELDTEQRNMAALLSKFRIDFTDVIIITEILKPPSEHTKAEFRRMISKYVLDDSNEPATTTAEGSYNFDQLYLTESDLLAFKDKNYRHMRLHELLQQHSRDAKLVVMTLPMPRKNSCPAVLYMAWLELLTKNMPPTMLVRGNQTNVLTFYS